MKKNKLVLLAKSNIYALPDYRGYINTDIQNKYKLYFISENNTSSVLVKKNNFGINIALPKQKSRLKFYLKVFFIIKRISPSIVHVFWLPLASLIPLLSRVTFQQFKTVGDFRTKSPFGGVKGKIKDIVLKIESLLFHKLITLDKELSSFIFKKEADCYIPMGYDKTLFYDKNIEKKYDFIYAGSISKDRGIYEFIKKFNEISNFKYTFLIIGWGDEENKIIELSKNNDNISFLPKVNREEVPKYYSMAKVGISYVEKSVLNIQQPTKILEYVACNIGVLANNSIGTQELVNNLNFNGFIFNDMKELNGFKLNKYNGANISKYAWQEIVKTKLIPFYESLLK